MSTQNSEAIKRERGRRLKALRLHLGQKTAKAGAAFFKVKYDTYVQHERGERDLTRDVAADYAAKSGVEEVWLLWGRSPPEWAVEEFGAGRDEPEEDLPNRLGAWREHARMSVQDLAERIGATVGLIEAWEAGVAELSDKRLRRIADVLGTTPGSILDVDPRLVTPAALDGWRLTVASQRDEAERQRAIRSEAA